MKTEVIPLTPPGLILLHTIEFSPYLSFIITINPTS
jgi:hypothetical protein